MGQASDIQQAIIDHCKKHKLNAYVGASLVRKIMDAVEWEEDFVDSYSLSTYKQLKAINQTKKCTK